MKLKLDQQHVITRRTSIALFAARDILPYEELTYDYGYVVGSVEGKTLRCLCGAPSCRGYLF